MSKSLPLDEMTVEEKLQTMETIWDDLTDNADNIQSPEWHDKILIDREKKLNDGSEEIIDWSVAKSNIKKNIS